MLLGTPDQIADAIRRDRALAEYGDFASSHIDTDHVRWAGDVAQAILNAIAADLAAEPGRQQQGDAERHHSRLRVDVVTGLPVGTGSHRERSNCSWKAACSGVGGTPPCITRIVAMSPLDHIVVSGLWLDGP